MDIIKLTQDKLSVEEAAEAVTAPNCGAVSLFVGTTRDNFEDKRVVSLEYEAYEPMAEKAIKEICKEMREKWNAIENVAVFHRLGKVEVKESSVVIAISSPHRADALQATQWCIDTLKKTVPIWKKEIYADKTEPQWKENSECPWSKVENKSTETKPEFKVKTSTSSKLASHLVQINCTNEELNRRIETFMKRKRDQANLTNIKDFCGAKNGEDTCARVDAVLTRQKNSKSHLRMQRVYNTYGPYNVTPKTEENTPYVSEAIEQRVGSIEKSLDIIKPVSPDIYHRLKQIEDRILFLESVSPEYAHFWVLVLTNSNYLHFVNKSDKLSGNNYVKKRKYNVHDIDNYLYELEKQAHTKQLGH